MKATAREPSNGPGTCQRLRTTRPSIANLPEAAIKSPRPRGGCRSFVVARNGALRSPRRVPAKVSSPNRGPSFGPGGNDRYSFPPRPLRCRLRVMASRKLAGPVYDRHILFLLHLRNVSGLHAHSVKPGADARIGRELKAAVFGRVRVGVERYIGDRIPPGR